MTTDRGRLHTINGIVTDVRTGQSDGSLTCYQLTIRDVLSVMERRTNSRLFRTKNLPDILAVLLQEWRQRSSALAGAFEFDLSGLQGERYPARELTRQVNESDAHFIRRLLRRDGATVFVKAGKAGERANGNANDTPVHTLVFADDSMKLPRRLPVPFAITVMPPPKSATRSRWGDEPMPDSGQDRPADMGLQDRPDVANRTGDDRRPGDGGNDLGHLLADSVIDIPRAGNSSADLDRIGKDHLAHELRAESVDGVSNVRTWPSAIGLRLPSIRSSTLPAEQRQFVVTSLHHRVRNNLPKELNERAQSLFAASRVLFNAVPTDVNSKPGDENDRRYENTFSCVRGVPLTPAYDPHVDLPAVHPMTAVVVGPDGEEVFCDEMGRIRVQIQG